MYLYVDNLYINILQRFGIIFALLIGLVITYGLINASKKNAYQFVMIWMLYLLHGLIDDLVIYISYCGFGYCSVNLSLKIPKGKVSCILIS